MLTRCPACATHFRVTPEQLKARSGRVRCGQCQHVFNALDSLIEEPMAALHVPPELPSAVPPANAAANLVEIEATLALAEARLTDIAVSPEPTFEPVPEAIEGTETASSTAPKPPLWEPPRITEVIAVAEPTQVAAAEAEELVAPLTRQADAVDWRETFPEPPPAPRRWPWMIGCLLALLAIGLQAVLTFRVELAVLMPEAKPALRGLCSLAGCEVGLPAKAALIGIEASDLHPDNERPGRLALTATLKNRAPFAQKFPHLELTLTDTVDKAMARKILTPADYLPPKTAIDDGMPANADITLAVGVDPTEITASGYRLYLFYP